MPSFSAGPQALGYLYQARVTEHANLPETWFQNALVEEPWRNGRALIPESWLKE
jgi:hypothetical protein